MMIVGLTGGIGSGKTTVAKMFHALGVPVYNSDIEAKKLMSASKDLKAKIIALLGEDSYSDNVLNRSYIANKVFTDPALLAKLNAIVHPEVKNHFTSWVKNQKSSYVIQETAIIFENSSEHRFDKIILVTAPENLRIERVISRDTISIEKVKERIDNQWSDKKKAKLSDYVIHNLDLEKTSFLVAEIHKQLLKLSSFTY
ncbi:Dephospho-CoA kinase [Cellulophaga algicola DSM 14237]|uniref:Dephospho-CoA kinase n=1 Tax=Cellulophaga algicola (strain DSM 14237 / IC166 / ACAM 630) TaxID=688270 RepID=E6X4B6_CELAD|nr:dephospho-CoA kinase [Cellulophaga algicola]ADV51499.1 Dephospho-CoA kinase [Cellulophaga algicola DSM 14237]